MTEKFKRLGFTPKAKTMAMDRHDALFSMFKAMDRNIAAARLSIETGKAINCKDYSIILRVNYVRTQSSNEIYITVLNEDRIVTMTEREMVSLQINQLGK